MSSATHALKRVKEKGGKEKASIKPNNHEAWSTDWKKSGAARNKKKKKACVGSEWREQGRENM